MKYKTEKPFVYLFITILVISLTLFFGCNKNVKVQLNESVCIETGEGCHRIINRGTELPTSFTDTFSNMEAEQETVLIRIYQGEDIKVESNRLIGNFELPIKKADRPDNAEIQVTFMIDQSKKLTIVVKDLETGRQDEILAGIVN